MYLVTFLLGYKEWGLSDYYCFHDVSFRKYLDVSKKKYIRVILNCLEVYFPYANMYWSEVAEAKQILVSKK